MDPIPPTKSNGTHRVLRQVIAQLQFGIFRESHEFAPQSERVVAGLGQRAPSASRLPLPPPLLQMAIQRAKAQTSTAAKLASPHAAAHKL